MSARLAKALNAAGHRCAVQHDGEDVLDIARKHEPDLLVLDLMLPGISGFQLCREIRSDEKLYRMPILVVSAMSNEQEIEHGLAQGADEYIAKPFTLDNFVQRVNALLRANQDTDLTDPITALADSQGFRKEMQRKLAHSDPFALVYIELLKLRPYAKAAGAEARDRALRHLARAINQCGERFGSNFAAGHLGGGHFLCLLPPNRATAYCERIQEAWARHEPSLLAAVPANYKGAAPSLDLLFCITSREKDEAVTPTEMVDVVSRIRQLRAQQAAGGIHIDRRHANAEPA